MTKIVTLTMNPALDIATSTDQIVPERKLRCDTPRYDPGGGGINVARAVHALGVDALAVFPAGGAAGNLIGHLLYQEGVEYKAIPITGFTRESLNVIEREHGAQYRFILPGPRSAASTSSSASTNCRPQQLTPPTSSPAAACHWAFPTISTAVSRDWPDVRESVWCWTPQDPRSKVPVTASTY